MRPRQADARREAPLGGVVTSVEDLAADAGAAVLRAGGNATDAALATAFAQGVVDPIYCGIAGGFHGIFHDARRGETRVISAGGVAPLAARDDLWTPVGRWGAMWTVEGDRNRYGYQASMVPGFIRGAWEAFDRFGSGRVTWADLIEPAIALATDGFPVSPYLYRLWMPRTDRMPNFLESGDGPRVLNETKECARVYLKADGSVYGIGETLRLPDYANTLSRIAEQGPDEFYVGETGARIAADFQANGGLLSEQDLRDYRPEIEEPIHATFRDLGVLTESSPSVGPVTVEILNIIEGWDLAPLGWNSAEYLDLIARAMHVGFVDRHEVLGDPRFVDVPQERLLSKAYAAKRRGDIERASSQLDRPTAPLSSGTTHTSVMDAPGNAAAITHSLGMSSGVVTPGLGFQHNCHMVMFDPAPGQRNSIAPGKRPITGGGPMLFMRNESPWLVIGSPAGARKVSAIVQVLLDVLDFNMPLAEAVAADRIHVEDEPGVVMVEPHFDPTSLVDLARLGHQIRFDWYSARIGAVMRDLVSGKLTGASDPRGGRGLAVV